MSMTLATIADALIEFILSLLRDPDAAEEFAKDPEAALTARGLGNATAADVCAVAPVIAERAQVVPVPAPKPAPAAPEPNPTVREINSITNSFSYIDDRDTLLDQSVNQNIWADGDVTQVFDQDAVVASGDDAIAAGNDATQENNLDQSTDIDAGDDVAIGGSDVTENTTTGSGNTSTDTTTTTDASTTTTVTDSMNSTTGTTTADESFNDSTVAYAETTVDSETTGVFESSDTVVMEEAPADDNF